MSFQVVSFSATESTVQEYKRRKAHKKEKSGCLACRAKRVKCDEGKPTCNRCQRNKRACFYDTRVFSQQVLALEKPTFSLSVCEDGIPNKLIQHLERHQGEILCMPASQKLIDLFHTSPLVRRSIIALAACHLRQKSSGLPQHRVSELFQQSIALRLYQEALATPGAELGQEGVNGLMLSAMIMNMMAFLLPVTDSPEAADPYHSWVFSPDPNRLGWLALQAGLRPLMLSLATYVVKSMDFLTPLFMGVDVERFVFPMKHGLEVVSSTWLKAFGYKLPLAAGCDAVSGEDVFRPPLIVLSQIRDLPPHRHNVFHNISFLVKLYPHFRSLLYGRDVKAMWMFGYWLGLMSRYNGVWWAEQRVRRDYEATKMWLRMSRVAERDATWKLMIEELESLYTPPSNESSPTVSSSSVSWASFDGPNSMVNEKAQDSEIAFVMLS